MYWAWFPFSPQARAVRAEHQPLGMILRTRRVHAAQSGGIKYAKEASSSAGRF